MTKQIMFKVSDEISDEVLEEMESALELCLLDLYDEVEIKDGVVTPRYLCRWCIDDITKEQVANQDELCNECYAEQQDDGDN